MDNSSFYISSIKIQNLFGHQQLQWNTFTDVNILGGINGSGKSTVLKSCYALLKDGFIADEKLAKLSDSIDIKFTNGYTFHWNKQKIESTEYQREEGFEYYLNSHSINQEGFLTLQKTQVLTDKGNFLPIKELLKQIHVYLINSFEQRILAQEKVQTGEGNDRTYLDYLIHEQIFKRNSHFTGVFEKLLNVIVHQPDLSQAIQKKEIQGFLLFYSSLQQFMEEYEIRIDNQIRLKRKGSADELSYEDLSTGEKQLILLLLMITNTAQAPCIFFMDEPDLGMHVEWKEKLIRQMRELNPHMQILLSTHAPSMIEGWQNRVKEVSQIITH